MKVRPCFLASSWSSFMRLPVSEIGLPGRGGQDLDTLPCEPNSVGIVETAQNRNPQWLVSFATRRGSCRHRFESPVTHRGKGCIPFSVEIDACDNQHLLEQHAIESVCEFGYRNIVRCPDDTYAQATLSQLCAYTNLEVTGICAHVPAQGTCMLVCRAQ